MTRSDIVLAGLLAVAGLLVAAGAATLHVGAGLIAGGVLLGCWSFLVLAEVEVTTETSTEVDDAAATPLEAVDDAAAA